MALISQNTTNTAPGTAARNPSMSQSIPFNVLTATAKELQAGLTNRTYTSLEIVNTYLAQIERFNHAGLELNAVISVCPREVLHQRAAELDEERLKGQTRGPLHGIPVVIKDAIMTGPELRMPTTVGSHVFSKAMAQKSAGVVRQLEENGLIILGKTNMTEFLGLKATMMSPGWSAHGGQTKSPFARTDQSDSEKATPGGSSSGSAVALAAGFAPLSIGTETAGSLVWPASRNGLYALKLAAGTHPMDGVFKLSSTYDCLGVMGKCVEDVANLADCVVEGGKGGLAKAVIEGKRNAKSWRAIQVGFLDVKEWGLPAVLRQGNFSSTDIQKSQIEATISKIRNLGGRVDYPVECPKPDTLKYHGHDGVVYVAFHEFAAAIEEFIAGYSNAPVRTLEDIVRFNEENAEKAMPEPHANQADLHRALSPTAFFPVPSFSPSTLQEARRHIHSLASAHGAGHALQTNNLSVLAAPSDSAIVAFSAAAGFPSATVPLAQYEHNDQPWGLFLVAKRTGEQELLEFMRAWEEGFDEGRTAGWRWRKGLV